MYVEKQSVHKVCKGYTVPRSIISETIMSCQKTKCVNYKLNYFKNIFCKT